MPRTPHVEQRITAGEIARDIVSVMFDGLTAPFALATGASGAVDSKAVSTGVGAAFLIVQLNTRRMAEGSLLNR